MLRLLLTLVLLVSSLVAQEFHALEKVSLQLHWKYQFEFAGFIAAKEMGYYKDAGLDVTLKEYNFGTDIEEDVLGGKSEYGIYNSLSLLEYLRGKPLVLVASYFKRAALVLVASPDIRSPKDLIGKTIMASTKEDFILNFKPYFDIYGVSIDDVKIVPHTYSIDDFTEGKVDAMTAFISNEVTKLDDKNITYNILDPSNENLYVLQLELITSQKELQEHPRRVEKFREASLKGWQYALKHKEEISKIICDKYSQRNSYADVLQEGKAVEKLILPYTYNIGSIDKSFLNKQMNMFKKEYKVDTNKSWHGFIIDPKAFVQKIKFTKEEEEYILANRQGKKIINLCLQYDQFPLDGFENGKFVGVMSDIYAKISKKTGLSFHIVTSNSRSDLKEKIDAKTCDLLSFYPQASKNYKTLKPTDPVGTTHFTLVSSTDKSFVSHEIFLKDKLIITQFEVYKKYLQKLYPYLQIKVVPNNEEQIRMLLDNEAYALVTLDEQADYIVDKTGYGKFKVNGFIAKDKPILLSIGVQKESATLYSIIQKSLHFFSKSELIDIFDSWKITRYQSVKDYSLVFKVLAVMTLILLIMFYFQRKQRNFNKELEFLVADKTKALREINEYLEETVTQKVEELIRKDEILTVQSKQAVMGEMISMIAHQWRQPLNTITLNISNLQIKQMMGIKIDDEMLNKSYDEISETISYLSETIDDFKTFFHPDKKSDTVKIDELLAKAVQFAQVRAVATQVKIKVITKPSFEVSVYANELIQVLLNILNNAIDAYSNINSEKKLIEIYAQKNETSFRIEIKDMAGGIKQEIMSKLFEPYFSTKGKNGTGLGLYMSQMIIEKQFNGKLLVESKENWTRFIIEIPIIDHV